MGFLDSFGDMKHDYINKKLTVIDGNLLTLRLLFVESERHRFGLTSDEDYKKWLDRMNNLNWKLYEAYEKILEALVNE